MIIIVLGSEGFIAKALIRELTKLPYEIIMVNRQTAQRLLNEKSSLQVLFEFSGQPLLVVNLIGSWKESSDLHLREDNYKTPKRLLEQQLASNSNLLWFQASSYFQLYKTIYGRHKNNYARIKQEYSDFLKGETIRNPSFKVVDYFLPHIIGPGEHQSRVFPQVSNAAHANQTINLTSGNAVIPILDVRDLVNRFVEDITGLDEREIFGYTISYPQVTRIESLKAHIESLVGDKISLCNFGTLTDRENEFNSIPSLREYFQENPGFRKLKDSFPHVG
jgi:nucleoside-diphosphate-sugar epimerase